MNVLFMEYSLVVCKSNTESFAYLCHTVGCSEMLMANAVQRLAATTPGKESMAMEGFAKALRQVSHIIPFTMHVIEHSTF